MSKDIRAIADTVGIVLFLLFVGALMYAGWNGYILRWAIMLQEFIYRVIP